MIGVVVLLLAADWLRQTLSTVFHLTDSATTWILVVFGFAGLGVISYGVDRLLQRSAQD
jgi:hypothetical protein